MTQDLVLSELTLCIVASTIFQSHRKNALTTFQYIFSPGPQGQS